MTSCALKFCGLAALVGSLTAQASAGVRVDSTDDPLVVNINLQPLEESLGSDAGRRAALVERIGSEIQLASAQAGERLVLLKPADFELCYDRLPMPAKLVAHRLAGGSDPQKAYESAVANLLNDIMAAAKGSQAAFRMSVPDLPVEADRRSEDSAKQINGRYQPVIDAMDALTTTRGLIMSGSALSESITLRRAVPIMVHHAEGRPVFFRTNDVWRAATGLNARPVELAAASSPAKRVVIPPPPVSSGKSSASNGNRGAAQGGQHKKTPTANNGPKTSAAWRSYSARSGSKDSPAKKTSAAKNKKKKAPKPTGDNSTRSPWDNIQPSSSPATVCNAAPTMRLLVNQETSPTIQALYPDCYASDAPTIYQQDIDPDHTGTFARPDLFQTALEWFVPADYDGPVCIDWEDIAMENLYASIGTPEQAVTIQQYVACIQFARTIRPKAKFGFFGVPQQRYWDRNQQWHDLAESLQPIYDESDVFFPCIYDIYADADYPNQAFWDALYVQDNVKLALEMADGKPVYPYVMPRFLDSNPTLGAMLIPEVDFRAAAVAATQAIYNGQRIAGLVWWGADYTNWEAANEVVPPSDPTYELRQYMLSVFLAEMRPGDTPQEHFDRIHKVTIKALAESLQAAPQ